MKTENRFVNSNSDFDTVITDSIMFPQKKRYLKQLQRIIDNNPFDNRYRCGCQHDCCGCICGVRNEIIKVSDFGYILRGTVSYNY